MPVIAKELKEAGSSPRFEVRRDWEVVRLWNVAKIRSERKNDRDLPLLSVFLNRGVIPYGDGGGQVHKPGLDLSVYQVVHDGDFVLNNQQAWRGSVGVSKYDGIISPAYIVLALGKNLDSRFSDYLFQSRYLVAQYVTSSKGVGDIQRDINLPWLKNVRVPIPSVEEQRVIAKYLAWATIRLDRATRAKRRVIELLNEQKQAIIQRTVTRGLDPNVRLKPSGIEWLGEIPEHWSVLPIKRALGSVDYGISDASSDDGRIPVLGMGNIRDGIVTAPPPGGVNSVDPALFLRPGDLLFNRTNSAGLVGKVGLFQGNHVPTTFASYLVRLRTNRDSDPGYLNFVLNSAGILRVARQMAIPSLHQSNLNPNRYGRIQIALPPLQEQMSISSSLRCELSGVDSSVLNVTREIDLLREYRTRLIADVVTGRLDVRGVEVPELNGVEEVSDIKEELEDSEELVAVEENVDAD